MSDDVIELREVRKSYGALVALDGVSLSVARGEIFGYVGANGAGKTTTIKILTGLIHPTSGTAAVCGRNVHGEPLTVKALLGYLPESGAVFEKLSPREFLSAVAGLYRLGEDAVEPAVSRWLSFFELTGRADERIGSLSKGNKQKICWAAALLHDPQVLVLDEPLNGLDVETVAKIKDLLRRLSAEGRTVFYSSHLIDVVEKVCTRVAVLHRGRLLASGTPDEVRALAGADSLEQALLKLWQ